MLDDSKLKQVDSIYEAFSSADKANKIVKLKAFSKFKDTHDALEATAALVESKLSKGLKKFLQKNIVEKDIKETLAVADAKLGGFIKEALGIPCEAGDVCMELMRGLRNQMTHLIAGLSEEDLRSMRLGLSHSLSRHRLKFSPEKVDTMIIQSVSLLDDVDKELNTYAMRVKEWYGWHFPELAKILNDNIQYAKVVLAMGTREKAAATDFSTFLDDDTEHALKETAAVSMGTEISGEDLSNMQALARQCVELSQYREQLFDYLQHRMRAIAPNLTTMVGELVGARLIAHAGSLMSLAKAPASTVQILGAEKALFRALKTKHETPKYGLIYHASLIGQASSKNKGKIARVLATKTSLSVRVDALAPGATPPDVATAHRASVQMRLQTLEGGSKVKAASSAMGKSTPAVAAPSATHKAAASASYNTSGDVTMSGKKEKKQKLEEGKEKVGKESVDEKKDKKDKKEKKDKSDKKDKKEKDGKKDKKRSRDSDSD